MTFFVDRVKQQSGVRRSHLDLNCLSNLVRNPSRVARLRVRVTQDSHPLSSNSCQFRNHMNIEALENISRPAYVETPGV
ncbi:hypothetical protein Pdw03_4989 [Penicillium digitatum]|uniref:Uncharacterized protein n=1 Tax=Penicillium digitatum TaxID=36651 RepID=A0A7T6XJ95_PENDI|nr:hypothetical protein Pdw03_4989 [Penicillium digitatum]